VNSRAYGYGDVPAGCLLMLARRHLVSSATHLTSFASAAQPAAGQAFSSRDVSGAASTAHFPRHGGSTCSHGLGDLAIAIGAMQLPAPSAPPACRISSSIVRRSRTPAVHSFEVIERFLMRPRLLTCAVEKGSYPAC
jgi:hypothetical protein